MAHRMMPLFMVTLGGTLDELGERSASTDVNPPSIVDSVETFAIQFAVFGAVAGLAGFTFVTVWSIAGERQVGGVAATPRVAYFHFAFASFR